jgi:hypothetical protein
MMLFTLSAQNFPRKSPSRLRQRNARRAAENGLQHAALCHHWCFSLLTYERLTHEQPAAEIMLSRLGDRYYRATLTYPSNLTQSFELRGDEWQIDARVLKWRGLANIAGFDTVYRLERIGGRYRDIDSERGAPRTVHVLNEPARIDAWELARRYREYVPWVDALSGSATFLPMADGALYQVSVSQSGLVARPLNQAGREAVAGWR